MKRKTIAKLNKQNLKFVVQSHEQDKKHIGMYIAAYVSDKIQRLILWARRGQKRGCTLYPVLCLPRFYLFFWHNWVSLWCSGPAEQLGPVGSFTYLHLVDTINPNDSNIYYDYHTGLSPLDLNISAGPDNDTVDDGRSAVISRVFSACRWAR